MLSTKAHKFDVGLTKFLKPIKKKPIFTLYGCHKYYFYRDNRVRWSRICWDKKLYM